MRQFIFPSIFILGLSVFSGTTSFLGEVVKTGLKGLSKKSSSHPWKLSRLNHLLNYKKLENWYLKGSFPTKDLFSELSEKSFLLEEFNSFWVGREHPKKEFFQFKEENFTTKGQPLLSLIS